MVIQCPKCNKKYTVNENQIPIGGAAVRCPNCGNIFTIYREVSNIQLIPYEEKPSVTETVEAASSFAPRTEESVSESIGINKSGEFPETERSAPESIGSEEESEQANKIANDFEKILNTSSYETKESVATEEETTAPPNPEPAVANDKISALWEKFKSLSGETTPPPEPEAVEETHNEEPVEKAPSSFEISSETPTPPETEVANPVETAGESISKKVEAEREKARKLARALAKDIKLYHGDKVKQGLEEGNLVELIGSEIKKSWRFYQQKVSPEILHDTTFFEDALNEIVANGQKLFKFKQ